MNFGQNYWHEVSNVLKKMRFVFKADLCGDFGLCEINKYMILFVLLKLILYNAHYVKWRLIATKYHITF